jgi:UDP:flavonoid glycosyltransferase YjiC (YdhE family)
LVVGLFPDWYGKPQADWPPQIELTGFPLFDGGESNELPPPLLAFCRAADPPVAFTFGTGMAHPAELFRQAQEACSILGIRGIFLTKYPDQLANPLPPGISHCRFAPFQKLFPLCAAVVHHGGIGTVAKAMAAGVPQLLCSMCFDQMDNGVRTNRLGAGDWIPAKRSSGQEIANRLRKLLTAETRARCQEIASRFPMSDALEAAAGKIERFRVKEPPH